MNNLFHQQKIHKPYIFQCLAMFLYVQILEIVFRCCVLAQNGFSDYIFSSFTILEITASFVVTIILFIFLKIEDQFFKGYAIIAFWSLAGYHFCVYMAKQEMDISMIVEVIGMFVFVLAFEMAWMLFKKNAPKLIIPQVAIAVSGVIAALIVPGLLLKTFLIFLSVTIIPFFCLLMKQEGKMNIRHICMICIAVLIWTCFSGYELGQHKKGTISYEGTEYRMVYNDAKHWYCINNDSKLVLDADATWD